MSEPAVPQSYTFSDAAVHVLKHMREQQTRANLVLRIEVREGCSGGLRYQIYFDDLHADRDEVREFGGLKVAVDRAVAPRLAGAAIDFLDLDGKQGFTIDNPNAPPAGKCQGHGHGDHDHDHEHGHGHGHGHGGGGCGGCGGGCHSH